MDGELRSHDQVRWKGSVRTEGFGGKGKRAKVRRRGGKNRMGKNCFTMERSCRSYNQGERRRKGLGFTPLPLQSMSFFSFLFSLEFQRGKGERGGQGSKLPPLQICKHKNAIVEQKRNP
jgi:hypothetical protein